MSDLKSPYLKAFYAHSVWGKYEFDVKFNDGINFISGLNGSNKTTLLNLIFASFLDDGFPFLDSFVSKSVLSDEIEIILANFVTVNDAQRKLIDAVVRPGKWLEAPDGDKLNCDPFSMSFINKMSSTSTDTEQTNFRVFSSEDKRQYNYVLYHPGRKGETGYIDPPIRICSPDLNQTTLKEDKAYQQAVTSNRRRVTETDERLVAVITRYLAYEFGLFEQAVESNMENLADLFAKRKALEKLINSFFNETGKKVVRNDLKEIAFQLIDSGEELDVIELSHGEKSLLYMLLTVFLDQDKIRIFLLDEPETALHLSWQKKLPDALIALAPDCQFIITTHSPGIVSGKWLQHMQDMSTIRRLQVSGE